MKKLSILSICLLVLSSSLFAQVTLGVYTCASDKAKLLSNPGKKASAIRSISFGEVVRYVGMEEYLASEKQVYIRVATEDEKVGWVRQQDFIQDGKAGTILREARIYQRPATPSTITLNSFDPGELVIRSKESEGWVLLHSVGNKKIGWIKNEFSISTLEKDVAMASRLKEILKKDGPDKKEKIKNLYTEAKLTRSSISTVLENSYPAIANPNPKDDPSNAFTQNSRFISPIATTSFKEQQVWDRELGSYFWEIVESGPAISIEQAVNYSNPYVAYHKNLEKGSKIRMDIPGNEGFVELIVVDKLDDNEQAIIALSPALMVSIFGTLNPGNVYISYPKP